MYYHFMFVCFFVFFIFFFGGGVMQVVAEYNSLIACSIFYVSCFLCVCKFLTYSVLQNVSIKFKNKVCEIC